MAVSFSWTPLVYSKTTSRRLALSWVCQRLLPFHLFAQSMMDELMTSLMRMRMR